jgi:hypothetical protein
VRPNAATASAARLDAAVAARDLDAVRALLADDMENLHHPTDTHYDREGALFSLRALAGARELHFEHVPLATLGDFLALFRCFSSFEELASDDMAPFGAIEREQLLLFEMDAAGRQRVVEFFAADRLGDAVVRLYERYAEILSGGPERARGAATARLIAFMLRHDVRLVEQFDASPESLIAPEMEFIDRRRIGFSDPFGESTQSCGACAWGESSRTGRRPAFTTSSRCAPRRPCSAKRCPELPRVAVAPSSAS